MTDCSASRGGTPADLAIWEIEATEDAVLDLAALDIDGVPVPRQFHITDMQHWIDLCA